MRQTRRFACAALATFVAFTASVGAEPPFQEAKLLDSIGNSDDIFGESVAVDDDTDEEDGDFFGWSVALDGDIAVIGAKGDDDNGSSAGSAYVFRLYPVDDVPATGGIGSALLLLSLLAIGFYFTAGRGQTMHYQIRRRSPVGE
jgi:hypothetical protein